MNKILKFLAIGIFILPFISKALIVEKVMAVVDDEMISLSQMESYRRLLSSRWRVESVLFDIRSRRSLLNNKKLLLDHLIDEKILTQIALKEMESALKISSPEELLKKKIAEKKISKKRLKKILSGMGISIEEYQNLLHQNMLSSQLVSMEVASLVHISDQELNDYYLEKRGKSLFTQYKYEFYQWEFEANRKEKELAQKLIKNKEFKNRKPQERALTQKQMSKKLAQVIPQLAPGQISKLICLKNKCYVFELLNKSFIGVHSQKAERMRKQLFKKMFLARFKRWIQEKRSASIIKKYI